MKVLFLPPVDQRSDLKPPGHNMMACKLCIFREGNLSVLSNPMNARISYFMRKSALMHPMKTSTGSDQNQIKKEIIIFLFYLNISFTNHLDVLLFFFFFKNELYSYFTFSFVSLLV